MLKLPLLKAVMGAMSYLASVILISWENLGTSAAFQVLAMVIGAMSVATVLCTATFVIGTTRGKIDYRKRGAGGAALYQVQVARDSVATSTPAGALSARQDAH